MKRYGRRVSEIYARRLNTLELFCSSRKSENEKTIGSENGSSLVLNSCRISNASRLLLKERKEEDAMYGDKEKFVTTAYKKKLIENQRWEAEGRLSFVSYSTTVFSYMY